ncbi:hypothetical protein [Kitasatospora viridis]|uniref:LPXTG-motif cell wall-anchored protein n=1 Tax=Kitasatospora viridis TaxID=281105 RepID=A0A561UDA5_9ACTN|nr:hypothetical protein [Kitasatospora viridis]TWF97339.1 hypothetical protein FHX73_111119 [Kitasatospora viridis]
MSSPTVVRSAALLAAATALTVLPVLPAGAAEPGGAGSASATTAEVALRVGLLDHAAEIPVDVVLNKVQSPAEQHGSLLTADVQGVAQPGPVTLVRADVGSSTTHVDAGGAHAAVQLVNADLNTPGLLPDRTLIGLQALSAEADCPAGGQPTAEVTAPARLTVLGHSVTLSLYGTTHIPVPGIGTLDVQFSPRTVTSTTAAASALVIQLAVNPLNLNVAKVDGTITVASVSCAEPQGASASASAPSAPSTAPSAGPSAAQPVAAVSTPPGIPGAGGETTGTPSVTPTKHASAGGELAFTGSGPVVPLAGTGVALLLAGAATVVFARSRRRG